MYEELELVQVPPELWEEVGKVARPRRADHTRFRNARPDGIVPGTIKREDDLSDEEWGCLAEMMWVRRMRGLGIPVKHEPMYLPPERLHEKKPWDAVIDGYTIEIKATPPNENGKEKPFMLVNKAAFHRNPTAADFYVSVKFLSKCECVFPGFETGAIVPKAIERTGLHDPAYSLLLTGLRPEQQEPWILKRGIIIPRRYANQNQPGLGF